MDARHYQTLLNALKQRDYGRTTWLAFKEQARWLDLSTADFTRRSMRGYDLSGADLSMAIFRETDLTEADFSDANLKCADMRRAELRCAILDRARLTAANLQDANLADACLESANLTRAKLARVMLTGADLAGADLTGADLTGASLRYARLTGARLLGADVSGADLTGAVLDDNVPAQVVNYHKIKIEKRAYQDMRSRVELTLEEPDDEISQARLLRVDSRRPQPRPTRAGDGNGRTEQAPKTEPRPPRPEQPQQPRAEAKPKSYVPPVRDAEPDLATVEGCCQALGVPPDANMDQIVKAFRSKAKLYHPDKVRNQSERMQELAAEEFRRLRRAYEALTRRTARPLTGVNWPEGMPRFTSPYDYTSEQYETLARLNPANTNILYNLAWKWFEDGRYAEARAGFERVLAVNPGDADAQYNLIIVRLYSELLLPSLSE